SVHPLHEVAERGRLSAVVGFPVGELLPIPILVALCARCHVLSPPGKHLVLVRDVLRKQKIEPGLAGLRITHSPALELLADDFLTNLDVYVVSHSLSPPSQTEPPGSPRRQPGKSPEAGGEVPQQALEFPRLRGRCSAYRACPSMPCDCR